MFSEKCTSIAKTSFLFGNKYFERELTNGSRMEIINVNYLKMWKLVTEESRWALRDNSMIFSNVIWISKRKEYLKWHLIDENRNEIDIDVESCLVPCEYFPPDEI